MCDRRDYRDFTAFSTRRHFNFAERNPTRIPSTLQLIIFRAEEHRL